MVGCQEGLLANEAQSSQHVGYVIQTTHLGCFIQERGRERERRERRGEREREKEREGRGRKREERSHKKIEC